MQKYVYIPSKRNSSNIIRKVQKASKGKNEVDPPWMTSLEGTNWLLKSRLYLKTILNYGARLTKRIKRLIHTKFIKINRFNSIVYFKATRAILNLDYGD